MLVILIKTKPYNMINKKIKENEKMKMKKLLIILLMPLMFLIVGCKSDLEKESKNLNTYTMELTYNNDHTFTAKQTLNYKNNEDTSLENLNMHLYPRAFREGANSSVISNLNYSKCYYNGISYGDINITSLKVNGSDSDIVIGGNDEDILIVKFKEDLAPDNSTEIYIEYTFSLPNINHRYGYGEDTINVANFYPIACIYEDGNFNIDSYHYNGDPFYSEMSNYNVTLHIPEGYKVASTGKIVDENTIDGMTTYNINAITVRDFAFTLSDKFNILSDTINKTKVNYYYYKDENPNESLKAGVDAVRTFNEMFGEYPYDTLNIAEANFVHGGMEFPGLVLISGEVDIQSDYLNVIIHEVAHQWWYGIVGNNQFNYGWLDEGLTEYSTLLFYEKNPEYNVNTKELIKNTTNSFVTFVEIYNKVFDKVDTTMNRKLNEYSNESEYVYIAYVKGMLIFDNIRELIGDEKFMKGLQTYFNDYKYKIATPDGMISSFEKGSNSNLKEVFDSWINGKVQILQIN